MKSILLFAVAAFIAMAAPVAAADTAAPVTVELTAEHLSVRPGESLWVGVHFEMQEGWHTYWKNPGDSGFAPELEWDLPEGFEVAQVQWPYPSRFEHSELVGFGYEESMTLLVEIKASNLAQLGQAEIGVHATWLACSDQCMPGEAEAKLSVPVLNEAPKADPQTRQIFSKARANVPQDAGPVTFQKKGGQVVLGVAVPKAAEAAKAGYFFPDPELADAFDNSGAHQLERTAAGFSLAMPADGSMIDSLSGVLVFTDASGGNPVALHVGGASAAAAASGGGLKFLVALCLAFVGGLILNLMPCVLPVISLKIMSFVNMAGGNRKRIFEHGAIFTLGVLVSFWALAAALLILRAYGEGVGWGFQLQEPFFLVILTMVIFALGLSLLGVFEFGSSLAAVGGKVQGKQGFWPTFLSGVLATVVATPCTGPFLGPALGYAVTLSAGGALLVFTAIGLGMSSPYLLLAGFPKLLEKMPKPGPWMIVFKQLMGFLMLATALWLLWVFQAEVDSSMALITLLLGLLVLGIGAWVYGKWGTPIIARKRRYVAYGVATLLAALALFIGARASDESAGGHRIVHAGSTSEVSAGQWVAWDPELFEQLRAEGKPVFVDFTAKWCLICQANKVPLSNVQERYAKEGVIMMEADWTKRDPVITAELEKFGRNGVPLYVLYGEEPQVLPQVLTSSSLIDALNTLHQ